MDFAAEYQDFSVEQLITEEKVLRNKANFVKNIVIDKSLGRTDGLVVQCCGSVGQKTDCPMCTYCECEACTGTDRHNFLYRGSVIPNRKNLSDPFTFQETWKSSDTLKCDSVKEGVYAILCVKPDCTHRGIVYVGESENLRTRCLQHKYNIVSDTDSKARKLHFHFRNHDGSCKLKYFRFVVLKEVLGGSIERQKYENEMIERFGTFGFYGFNGRKTKIDESESEPPEKKAKPETNVTYTLTDNLLRTYGNVRKERIVEPRIFIALALKNHPMSTPPYTATSAQLTNFGNYYFKTQPFSPTLHSTFKRSLNPALAVSPGHVLFGSEWFYWVNKPSQPTEKTKQEGFRYVFGIRPGFDQSIKDEIDNTKDDLAKLLDPEILKSMPDLLDQMTKGLLPLAPPMFR